MSGFLEKITDTSTEGGRTRNERFARTNRRSNSYGGQTGPSPPPYPWIARWDDSKRRYVYVNERTDERSWEFPHSWGGARSSSTYHNEYCDSNLAHEETRDIEERRSYHGLVWGLGGSAVGLGAGALSMQQIGENKHGLEADKYRVENGMEIFPDNAAERAGRKVGEVESFAQDVEQKVDRFDDRTEHRWDNVADDIEYTREIAADWVGEKVDLVKELGDGVDCSYDEGSTKYEGRNDHGEH